MDRDRTHDAAVMHEITAASAPSMCRQLVVSGSRHPPVLPHAVFARAEMSAERSASVMVPAA